jgi:hypothetical protein
MHPNVNLYFQTARERYKIRMLKEDMRQKAPWSQDPVFQDWRFCNVHREDDKTTVWFRKNIRDPLCRSHHFHQIMATIIFRWFNRIETGERIKDLILDQKSFLRTDEMRRQLTGVRPIVTGAYIIKCGDGMSKLEGILSAIEGAAPIVRNTILPTPGTSLQMFWKELQSIPWMGPFMAYEVVSDLRWTPVLWNARDILIWANPGPGCARGISRVMGLDKRDLRRGNQADRKKMLEVMNWLLTMARDKEAGYWPGEWKPWEMREVEHWACEFDKWSRVMEGDRMKQTYPGR